MPSVFDGARIDDLHSEVSLFETGSLLPRDEGESWSREALERLSHRQRTAVILVYSFDWTHEEVADVMGVSVSTVRNHLRRGMEKLRSALGGDA